MYALNSNLFVSPHQGTNKDGKQMRKEVYSYQLTAYKKILQHFKTFWVFFALFFCQIISNLCQMKAGWEEQIPRHITPDETQRHDALMHSMYLYHHLHPQVFLLHVHDPMNVSCAYISHKDATVQLIVRNFVWTSFPQCLLLKKAKNYMLSVKLMLIFNTSIMVQPD